MNGYNELGITPVIMELYNREGKKLEVYCADMNTPVVSGCGYNCKPIDKCNKFDRNICKHLEKILKNAYPYISIEEMQQRSGIKYIKKKEAITAVQYAIWHYTNNADIESEYSVVNELYKWLINLDFNNSGDGENNGENNGGRTKSVFLMTNNSVVTQVLIGIGEFAESESYASKETESSTSEENTTEEDNTTGKSIKSSSEEDTTDKPGNIIKGGNISKDTKQEDIIKANAQYSKSPKTGDSFVSIVVTMGVALSMVTIFIVLRGKRN